VKKIYHEKRGPVSMRINQEGECMMFISSRNLEIQLPWEPGLLEWLQEHYPVSGYFLIEE
jgi:hypothetical protein